MEDAVEGEEEEEDGLVVEEEEEDDETVTMPDTGEKEEVRERERCV